MNSKDYNKYILHIIISICLLEIRKFVYKYYKSHNNPKKKSKIIKKITKRKKF